MSPGLGRPTLGEDRQPDPAAMTPPELQAEIAQVLSRAWWRLVVINKKELDAPAPVERSCAGSVDERPSHPAEAMTP